MVGPTPGRTVMVRDWYEVLAIPEATVMAAFGGSRATLDPRVELVALTVEYWAQDGISPRQAAQEILGAMRGRIDQDNMYALVRILAERGYAHRFFALTRRTNDPQGELRRFLLGNGLLIDTIRWYDTWSGIDPKLFFDGFAVGVGESFAAIVLDLGRLVKLCFEVDQKILVIGLQVSQGDVSGLQEAWAVVAQTGKVILGAIDPRQLPAKILAYWREFNANFAAHLENLEPYEAGHQLGRLAGDLWQLLTGVVAFTKLVKVGGSLAMRFAPLVVSSVRTAAVESAAAIASLVELLVRIGKQAIDALPRIGLSALRTLITDGGMKALVEGRAAIAEAFNVTLMPPLAYAGAFEVAADIRMGAVVGQTDFSVMASVSETIPPALPKEARSLSGIEIATEGTRPRDFDKVLDGVESRVKELPASEAKAVDAAALDHAMASAAAFQMLESRLSTQLRTLLQKTTYELFHDMLKSGIKPKQPDFGRLVHSKMAAKRKALISQVSPGLLPYTEETLTTTANALKQVDPSVAARFKAVAGASTSAAEEALGQTIAQMLLKDEDSSRLLDFIGVDSKPAARTQAEVEKYLAKTFGWKRDTTVGSLRHDLLIVDPAKGGSGSMINVDFTSSFKLDRFEKLTTQVYTDLGDAFEGDWDKLADAYTKANKTMPPNLVEDLDALRRHAVRETIIRRAAMMSVFGELWNMRSYEMLYDTFYKLFSKVTI